MTGLLAAIAGVASGFTANLLIVTTDVLLSGISSEAAKALSDTVYVSVWILLLLAWYALGLPIGPGVWPTMPAQL